MAYFAEIENGKVKQVLVLNDSWTEQESLDWLQEKVSSNLWVKTDINGSIRNKYAGIGDEYHSDIDKFISKVPFESWVLDKERGIYLPPIPKPLALVVGYAWKWSVKLKNWVQIKIGLD